MPRKSRYNFRVDEDNDVYLWELQSQRWRDQTEVSKIINLIIREHKQAATKRTTLSNRKQ
jgi:hypothetical protein